MLGYEDAACAITSNTYGYAMGSVPFWINNIFCTGSEDALDQCQFPGWGNDLGTCSHTSNDAGIVCANRKCYTESYH